MKKNIDTILQSSLRYWPITLSIISIVLASIYSTGLIINNSGTCLAYLCIKNHLLFIAFNLYIGIYVPIYLVVALPFILFVKPFNKSHIAIISIVTLVFSIAAIVAFPNEVETIVNNLELFLFLD